MHHHFLSLSFLLLFPASVAITTYPMLQSLFSDAFTKLLFGHANDDDDQLTSTTTLIAKTLLLALSFLLFTSVFSISALGSITYSVIQSFHGQPLNLKSSIKSIPISFFPLLLGTNLLVQVIFLSITLVFVFFFASLLAIVRLMGFQFKLSSPYFLILCFATVVAFFSVVIFLQVNWALSSVVVVAETTWRLASLKRSTSLVKGRRGLVLVCL